MTDIILDGSSDISTLTGGPGIDTIVLTSTTTLAMTNWSAATSGIEQMSIGPDTELIAANPAVLDFSGLVQVAFPGLADPEMLHVLGSSGDDILTAWDFGAILEGGDGNDILNGGAGDDFLVGGAGVNLLNGGGGADTMLASGNHDVLNGGAGNDSLDWNGDTGFSATLNGGDDNDALSIEGGSAMVVDGGLGDDIVELSNTNIASITGGGGSDTLTLGGDVVLAMTSFSAASSSIENLGVGRDIYAFSGDDHANVFDFSGFILGVYPDNLTPGVTVNGMGGNDTLVGTTSSDALYGGAGDDTLIGGDGKDVLDGGSGYDTVVLDVNFSLASLTQNQDGSWTVNLGADSKIDTINHAELLQFADRYVSLSAQGVDTADFNRDGGSDVLWRNNSGEVYVWNSQNVGEGSFRGHSLGWADNSWQIQNTGDFNGDGKADILWRNDNGDVYVSNSQASGGLLGQGLGNTSSDWHIQTGGGDFNGDGRADVLWRNDSGEVYLWSSQGMGQATDAFTGGSLGFVDNAWVVVGTGDFNGDGRSDVMWRNTDGDFYVWNSSASGPVTMTGQSISNVDAAWQVQGVGDFNGDGRSDILFRNTDGEVYVWNSNTNADVSFVGQSLGFVDNDWSIAAIGDYNGDGRSDVLFRNNDGGVYVWNSHASGPVAFDGQGLGITLNDWHIHSDWHG